MRKILIFATLIIAACASKDNKTSDVASYQFIVKQKIKLPLAADVSQRTLSLHSFRSDNSDYLFYLHSGLNKASVYDLNSNQLIKVIRWNPEGPDAVGYNADFGCMAGFDSIFLVSILEQRVFLTDTAGKLKQVFKMNIPITRPTGTFIHQLPGSAISFSNSSLYFNSYKSFWDDFSVARGGLRFNLSSKLMEETLPYPKIYLNGWWENYHTMSGIIKLQDSQYLLAWFAIDPDVYLFDQKENRLLKRYMGSEKLKIKPLKSKRPREFSIQEFENYYSHISKTGWYASVFYDPFRKLYYRIGFYGSNEPYSNSSQIYSKPFVLVFNQDFQKLGEFEIDSKVYNVLISFIGPQGICFLNKADQNREEGFLHFDAFQVESVK